MKSTVVSMSVDIHESFEIFVYWHHYKPRKENRSQRLSLVGDSLD